jgi:hypothetical protein
MKVVHVILIGFCSVDAVLYTRLFGLPAGAMWIIAAFAAVTIEQWARK